MKKHKIILWSIGAVAALLIIFVIAGAFYYNSQLAPVGDDISQLEEITIAPNSTSAQIGKQLQQNSIIRNSTVFELYARLSGKSVSLQAGTYRLSPAETTPQIIDHLVNGSVDTFSITFYPGATLKDTILTLKNAGYSSQEIATALSATYDSPLFAGRPENTDLEGYIYGETYNFNAGATVSDILERVFDEFYNVIVDNGLIKSFASHDLNLYQGITLASIIQREANTAQDQKQVAQVFYSRLSSNMVLGSDVTYQYIADKTGVARDTELDSPYNTRIHPGLPPGPISTPGITALQAVASPSKGDYLYFLSGDDDITYFAHTYQEHEANITDHCKIKCSTL
ncbi:MAG: hypothetical protein PWQ10_397 [Patescibacteria group bacterium]|nr:hypothetical protein [Patescibacteria group bacterium]